jgi:cellobiose-specific phosphotransferase system component IIC
MSSIPTTTTMIMIMMMVVVVYIYTAIVKALINIENPASVPSMGPCGDLR